MDSDYNVFSDIPVRSMFPRPQHQCLRFTENQRKKLDYIRYDGDEWRKYRNMPLTITDHFQMNSRPQPCSRCTFVDCDAFNFGIRYYPHNGARVQSQDNLSHRPLNETPRIDRGYCPQCLNSPICAACTMETQKNPLSGATAQSSWVCRDCVLSNRASSRNYFSVPHPTQASRGILLNRRLSLCLEGGLSWTDLDKEDVENLSLIHI